jgi:hypothetical protein
LPRVSLAKEKSMSKKPLQVTLHAKEPSVVELDLREKVQLDRLSPSENGTVAERMGKLLGPGKATVELARGFYAFKTLSDASLRVVRGGVDASTSAAGKDERPDPTVVPPPIRGDQPSGEIPRFTVE